MKSNTMSTLIIELFVIFMVLLIFVSQLTPLLTQTKNQLNSAIESSGIENLVDLKQFTRKNQGKPVLPKNVKRDLEEIFSFGM